MCMYTEISVRVEPIFHCNAKLLALGPRGNFALGIPICWYLKTLADPTGSLADPTQSLTDPTQSLTDPTQSLADPTQSLVDPTQSLVDPKRASGIWFALGTQGFDSSTPCTFHVVCVAFSALATQKLINANAVSGGIQS